MIMEGGGGISITAVRAHGQDWHGEGVHRRRAAVALRLPGGREAGWGCRDSEAVVSARQRPCAR